MHTLNTLHMPAAPDDAFDLQARAEMALAFEPGAPPSHLLRAPPSQLTRRSVQSGIAALLLLATAAATVLAMRPPELVRSAITHQHDERSLRGSFMDPQLMLSQLGLGQTSLLPGYPQLARPCDIDGHEAYHLTTFFDNGGLVTVFAFKQPVALADANGWWDGKHWRVIRSREGRALLLVAQKTKALAVAQAKLQGTKS